jgi:hypothetical protein
MKKTDLLIGFFIGILAAFLGVILFLWLFTELRTVADLQIAKEEGILGKVMTLGAILNLLLFFLLLKFKNLSKNNTYNQRIVYPVK